MNANFRELLTYDILSSYRVHYLELTSDSPYLSDLDFNFRGQLLEKFDYHKFFSKLTEHVTVEHPIEYIDELGLHYMIFENCDEALSEKTFICLGPFLYKKYTDSEIFQLIQNRHIPSTYHEDVTAFFHRITVISDMLSWQFMIVRIMARFFGQKLSFHIIDSNALSGAKKDIDDSTFTPKSTAAFAAIEARYKIEEGLIKAVTAGNIQEALYYYNMFQGFTLEPRNSDLLRNNKDMLIAVNTFLRKAVQAAHVHPLYIDNLNKNLTVDIENCTSDMQLTSLCTTIIRKYCLLVKSYSRAQYSELIRDCLYHIDFHYQETLSLQLLASKFMVSKSYLSSLFHKEVGMTITDYINTTRIRRSLLLLNTTSFSMQEIAEQCGFSDGNYFTRTFKKFQGMSPLKYRQSLLETE